MHGNEYKMTYQQVIEMYDNENKVLEKLKCMKENEPGTHGGAASKPEV